MVTGTRTMTTGRSAGWAVVAWALVVFFGVGALEEAKAGSKIVFSSNRDGNYEIYVMNASDGSNQKKLTTNPSGDISPAWSPDASEIAFTSDRDGYYEVYCAGTSTCTAPS